MQTYILRPLEEAELPIGENPWEPWYDKSFGFIINADTEEEARNIANQNAGDENRGEFFGKEIAKTREPWLSSKYSSCVLLSTHGPGLVMRDFASA